MPISGDVLVSGVSAFMWPLLRITAMLAAAPVLGANSIPVRVRLLLGLLLTFLVYPSLPALPAIDPFSPEGLLVGARQIIIGVAMGFILHMVFGALVIAGQSVAMTMGLGFASSLDPQNGVQVPVVSQYFLIFATLIFLALDGHLVLIRLLVESFSLLPVTGWPANLFMAVVLWGSQMFVGALLMALPAMAAVLLMNLALGVVTRAAPQLNIFAVGFPITILAGFVLLLLSLPAMLPVLSRLFSQAFETLQLMLL